MLDQAALAALAAEVGFSYTAPLKVSTIELKDAVRDMCAVNTMEEFIKGREVECAVFGNHGAKASVLGEIAPKKEFYDYEAKYQDDSTDLYIPARISEETADLVRELALAAYEALGCAGLSRVDFFVQDEGIILNEINTLPGFTAISMYPKLMMEGGMTHFELISGLIELALNQ